MKEWNMYSSTQIGNYTLDLRFCSFNNKLY